MKKSKVLATTILAGALLFTGVSATHYANASENVTKSQAEESVKNFVTNNSDFNPYNDTKYAEWQTALKKLQLTKHQLMLLLQLITVFLLKKTIHNQLNQMKLKYCQKQANNLILA